MNIFVDAISLKGIILLFDDNRNILDSEILEIKGNESSLLMDILDNFLLKNNILYKDLSNIVIVNGPGSFTGVRTISLIFNTLGYIYPIKLTDISYFDLYNNYPIIKSSSRRDCFLKKGENEDIEIIENDSLKEYILSKKINKVYGELDNIDLPSEIVLFDIIDYGNIIKHIDLKELKEISPLYIKKPNIC